MRQLLMPCCCPAPARRPPGRGQKIAGGSLDNFVYMMNARAKEIGCTATTFTDARGPGPRAT